MDNILKLMDEYIKHEKIEELKQIKAEFQDKILLNQTVAIQIIDEHIEKLKED